MNCLGDGDERGNYNSFIEILEIEFIFNFILFILCLLRFGFRIFIYLY